MNVAFLFPGQGSEVPGMLHALPDHPSIARTLDEASEALGGNVAELDSPTALRSTVSVQLVSPDRVSLGRTLTHTFVASLDTRRVRQEFEFIASNASSASTDLHSLLIQLLATRNLRVANLLSSWQHGCTHHAGS